MRKRFLLVVSLMTVGGGCTDGTPTPKVANSSEPQAPVVNREPRDEKSETLVPTTTPDRRVDTKQLVDVVKEEVKGGESSGPPTPEAYLWLPADVKLVKDEPMEVAVPNGLPALIARVPASNPMTKAKVELGKQLYFDQRISKNGTVSCATCHNPEKAWTDNEPTSAGIDGQRGGRNSPTVLNTAYQAVQFWDGRAPSLEAQAQGPVQNKIEMGDQSYKEIIERLRTIPGYVEQFKTVFGTDVTLDGMAKAIASFERTALSGNSPYDKYTKANSDDAPKDLKALSESAKRGMILFGLTLNPDDDYKSDVVRKKANCTSCHIGFNFTDDKYHNLGVGFHGDTGKFDDLGRFVIAPVGAKDSTDVAAFKTPTLRDIARTFPYMHDGSQKTLEDVVNHYDKGGNANPHLDKDMVPLKLTDQEKKDVVEFMKALTGEEIKVTLPKLPPGADGSAPDPAEGLKIPTKKVATSALPHFTR